MTEGGLAGAAETALASLGTGAGIGAGVALTAPAGYLDSALIQSLFRLRFDAAYGNNVPDRAEFFYAKCGCFRIAGLDPRAAGPPKLEKNVDYQELSAYLEVAATERLSGFVEIPARFINPQDNIDAGGLGDINAGFKFALISCDDKVVTFQLRTYAPTGDAHHGLGTDHTTLEPALLSDFRLGDRWTVQLELRDWIPLGGSDFAGNVIRYGVGVGFDVFRRPNVCVTPIVEAVGWTVLSGKQLEVPQAVPLNAQGFAPFLIPPVDAAGDTIVNLKFGVRSYFGCSDLYVGYGRCVTGDRWYQDILRVEYRYHF
jgi:hypothetical protein